MGRLAGEALMGADWDEAGGCSRRTHSVFLGDRHGGGWERYSVAGGWWRGCVRYFVLGFGLGAEGVLGRRMHGFYMATRYFDRVGGRIREG